MRKATIPGNDRRVSSPFGGPMISPLPGFAGTPPIGGSG